ncbi:hypothetical protein Hanom_Chr13g01226301 [Helianthus anomalus]
MVGFFFPWTTKKYDGATSATLKNGLMTSTTPKPYFHSYFLVKALVIHFHWAILSFFLLIFGLIL